MGDVYFYHLTRSPLEVTLPMLVERSLRAGWHVAIRARDRERLGWLDEKLWLGPDDGFLAHGIAGGPHDALQPVLLTTGQERANDAQCLMAVDGAAVNASECADLARVCILFDGNDAAAVDRARGQWKELTDAGAGAQYWSEEGGGWRKKAEKQPG
ncbi:MAG: DNA polymerase III subunit chi [Rhodobacteraceae bacterium]|nr:DNA polymerase III subunit chi [Paracoccaceae bacterium]MCB2134394.1 DNA polymerase III subunit chi [Paracoccaceae bacterium]